MDKKLKQINSIIQKKLTQEEYRLARLDSPELDEVFTLKNKILGNSQETDQEFLEKNFPKEKFELIKICKSNDQFGE